MEKNKTFSKNLRYYIERSGRTQKEIGETIGIKPSSITRYLNGTDFPRMDRVQKFADYFGILKSDLIEDGAEKEKEKENRVISDAVLKMNTNVDYYNIVEMLNNYDDAQLKRVMAYINLLNQDLKN